MAGMLIFYDDYDFMVWGINYGLLIELDAT